ncbi:hypothetical protein MAR_036248 [Mya arenaria]|uniref:Uncharacterized protein n=1 Tax=Mya arenaria TaxID=6604 RepID=A0ABY7EQD3_MYAAR|nr:hypothetical protein MAR_036248 [Mya arenaria]
MDVNWSNSESQKSLRTVLKWEIQHLLHRLSETGEETLLLTANTREFHVAGLGSEKGCEFLNSTNVAEIKSKFLSFCTACGDDSDDSFPLNQKEEKQHTRKSQEEKGIQEGKTGLDLLVENNGKDVSKTTKTESDLYPENDDNEDERHDLSDEESESDNEGNETDNQSTKKQTALTTVPSTFSDENLNSNSADLEPDPSYTEKLQSKDPDEKSCAEDSDTNDNGDSNDTEIGGYLASDHEESPKDVETRNFHGLFDIKQDMNI